jgi:hypothetical protein
MSSFEERQSIRDLEYAISNLKMRMAELERNLNGIIITIGRISDELEELKYAKEAR